jgi:hypothetical protein
MPQSLDAWQMPSRTGKRIESTRHTGRHSLAAIAYKYTRVNDHRDDLSGVDTSVVARPGMWAYHRFMGDTSSRARATQTADRALAERREALIALTLAADAARDGESVYTAAEKKAVDTVHRARERAQEIINQARAEADQIRAAAREEMAKRVDRWRDSYNNARTAGWTVKELRAVEQPRPPRVPANRNSTATSGTRSRGPGPNRGGAVDHVAVADDKASLASAAQ